MKKIGIITFHTAQNYGAILQAYALQKELERLNYNVKIINFKNNVIDNNYRLISIQKDSFKSLIKSLISSIVFFPKRFLRSLKFKSFLKNNIHLTSKYYSENELKNNSPKFDVYITGSDQVWNSNLTNGLQDSYTLNFGFKDIKRIAYAASLGNDELLDEEKEIYKTKISNINKISVREEKGKQNLLNTGIKSDIEVVLDPTLLLSRREWNDIISKSSFLTKHKKYILAYVVENDEEYIKILNNLSKKTGLKVIHFLLRNTCIENELKNAYTKGPLEFINLIKNAEYVVCTSFHSTVFSIIFNKKFWVIPHRKTGSRVTNLLDKLGISERAVSSLEEFEKLNYDKEIDYEKVNKKLDEERKKSIDWLSNAINS